MSKGINPSYSSVPYSAAKSRTNWESLQVLSDSDINLPKEHPEADLQHIVHGIVRRRLKPVFLHPSHWQRKTLFLFLSASILLLFSLEIHFFIFTIELLNSPVHYFKM